MANAPCIQNIQILSLTNGGENDCNAGILQYPIPNIRIIRIETL